MEILPRSAPNLVETDGEAGAWLEVGPLRHAYVTVSHQSANDSSMNSSTS